MSFIEVANFVAEVRALVAHAAPLVFIFHWRLIQGFYETFLSTIVWTMRRDNPKIRANGILIGRANWKLHVQVTRLLVESQNPRPRVFTDRGALATFLDPLLTKEEQRVRDRFLDADLRPSGLTCP